MRKRPFAGAVERELKRNEATRCESSSSSTAEAIRGSARTTASRGRVRCRAVPKQFVRCCCCGLAFPSQFLGGPLGSDSDSTSKWFGVKLNQSWPQLLNAIIIIISSGAESFNQCQCSISISLSIVLKFHVICHNCGHATLVTRWPTGPVHGACFTVSSSQSLLHSTLFTVPTSQCLLRSALLPVPASKYLPHAPSSHTHPFTLANNVISALSIFECFLGILLWNSALQIRICHWNVAALVQEIPCQNKNSTYYYYFDFGPFEADKAACSMNGNVKNA